MFQAESYRPTAGLTEERQPGQGCSGVFQHRVRPSYGQTSEPDLIARSDRSINTSSLSALRGDSPIRTSDRRLKCRFCLAEGCWNAWRGVLCHSLWSELVRDDPLPQIDPLIYRVFYDEDDEGRNFGGAKAGTTKDHSPDPLLFYFVESDFSESCSCSSAITRFGEVHVVDV